MGLLDYFLTEKRQKKESASILDTTYVDPNDGDSIVINGNAQLSSVEYLQYERGQTESKRIETYRQISKTAELDEVITDIINEAFIFQRDKKPFELDWHAGAEISDQLKEKIFEEFENVYSACKFEEVGSELIQSFYIDGRVVFQKVYDKTMGKTGIKQIIKLDPLNVVKVKLIPERDRQTQMIDMTQIKEFFVYSSKKLNTQNHLNNVYSYNDDIVEGVKLETKDITYVTSGLVDPTLGITIGHLDKAIIPYNNLKMMEQSMVIFRIVRAPMRRAFYVDVSSLPKARAEEYLKNMSARFRSKLAYNSDTGSWVDQKSVIGLTEDYIIPRFNESKTTEIQNIEGQSSQEILDEVNYMKDKLYQSLNAPKSRYTDDASVFIYGKSDQIPLDEYRYKKFIDRLRNRFMISFDDFLKHQLILKGIISEYDWDEINRSYFWKFNEDNAFIEFKDAEILSNRVDVVSKMADLIEAGYYSKAYIRKNILKQTEDEIAEIDAEIYKEKHQDPDKPPENYNPDAEKPDTEESDVDEPVDGGEDNNTDIDEPPSPDAEEHESEPEQTDDTPEDDSSNPQKS